MSYEPLAIGAPAKDPTTTHLEYEDKSADILYVLLNAMSWLTGL